MKSFHPLSFGLGLGTGVLVLVLVFGGMRAFGGGRRGPGGFAGQGNGNFQRMGGPMDTAAMAQRLGMTEAELQAELDAGKNFRQIAEERGVQMRMGGGQVGPRATGSGGTASAAASAMASQPSSIPTQASSR